MYCTVHNTRNNDSHDGDGIDGNDDDELYNILHSKYSLTRVQCQKVLPMN